MIANTTYKRPFHLEDMADGGSGKKLVDERGRVAGFIPQSHEKMCEHLNTYGHLADYL